MQVGIDIGAICVGAIFIADDKVVARHYFPHKGDIPGTLAKIIAAIPEPNVQVCVTGKDLLPHPDIAHLDSIVALTDGVCHLFPQARHIVYVGGETYTLIHVKDKRLQSYSSNSSCASGTGSFLEQQAGRLGMDISEFSECAAGFSEVPPRVATRCAVFAKSDIIHLQQDGVPVQAIAAGLCDSLVDGLVESLFKGEKLQGVTVVAGGVACNRRVIQSMARYLDEMIVDDYAPLLGAYGAALYACKSKTVAVSALEQANLDKENQTRPVLCLQSSDYPDFSSYVGKKYLDTEITVYQPFTGNEVYLGIDIGSTSTKAVLTGSNGQIHLGFYTATAGKPIDAVKSILRCLQRYGQENDRSFRFLGVATTGSGRKLLKSVLRGDLEVNEITAHAKAAVFLYPQVDTILEIGGQDAKFTRIANGSVSNAVMNYVCAAGTGSFIEEQAKRLNIPLEKFAEHAMRGEAPITSERCTVYMERDINRLMRQGWGVDDIAAAVIYSVRDNYLNKVVAGSPIGEHILFQGATARNYALVAAFEQYLQKPIKVFPYAHLTGAIGCCLLAQEKGLRASGFRGLDFIDMPVTVTKEVCRLCHNNCRLTVFETPEGKEAYGMMCGRDYSEQRYVATAQDHFDFLQFYRQKNKGRGTVVLPCALVMYEYLTLWRSFFRRLGFEVKIMHTGQKSFERGKQLAQAEFCAPLLSAQGLLWEASCQNADMIFFPMFYKESRQEYGEPVSAEGTPCFFCYYTSHLPALISSRLPENQRHKLVAPLLEMENQQEIEKVLIKHLKNYGIEPEEIRVAYARANEEYLNWKKANIDKGKQVLEQMNPNDIGLVILGRPYNTFDPVMNAGLVEKIVSLGYPTIYYDMLDLPKEKGNDPMLSNIHWNYGKKIYRAARFIADSDNLFPIYLTSFRCSPDAFIMTYFKYLLEHFQKPYLIVQLDEHCSDVGYLTRVEAAIDSFKSWRKTPVQPPTMEIGTEEVSLEKIILIPHVDEVAGTLVAAAFKANGYRAIVLEESPATVLQGFRFSTGGECVAIPAIIGGIIQAINHHKLMPENTVLFLPTSYVACNFPQFPVKIAMALEKQGMPVKVINTGSFNLMQRLLFKLDLVLWDILIVSHALRRLGCSLRPYEISPGSVEGAIKRAMAILEDAFAHKKNKGLAWEKVIAEFSAIAIKRTHRPKILVTGDLYVKNNESFNQNIVHRIEELGGEALTSSSIEYLHYGLELDRHEGEANLKQMATYYVLKKILENWEQYYFGPITCMLSPLEEPSWEEMFASLVEMGVDIGLQGETAITVSRAICLARAKKIQGVVHINPSFCCAGNVSASLLAELHEKYNVPVLNIFYDGTDQPNNSLVPFMHYLCQQNEANQETVATPG